MASHGRHGISAIVLGSETVNVLTHSKIAVLVYRWASWRTPGVTGDLSTWPISSATRRPSRPR